MSVLKVRDMYKYYLLDGNFVDDDSLGDLIEEYNFSKLDTGYSCDVRIKNYKRVSVLEVIESTGIVLNRLYLTRLTYIEAERIVFELFGGLELDRGV